MKTTASPSLLAILLLLVACGEDTRVAGNGTYIGNGHTSGRILLPSGKPAYGALVECIPLDFQPGQERARGWSAIVDSTGVFECSDLADGDIGIFAFDPGSRLEGWRQERIGSSTATGNRVDTLEATGNVRIALPPSTNGTLYFTGLSRKMEIRGEQDILLSDLPAGWSGSIRILSREGSTATLDSTVVVESGMTDSVGFTRDSIRLRIPLEGGLVKSIAQFPLLVRLDSSWHGFSASLPDGSDLRLKTTDGKALPLTIASWNPKNRTAALWTLLDSLEPPGDSVEVVLAWGLPMPVTTSASAFGSSKGWLAAWPLGDSGSAFQDRLGAYTATPTSITTVSGPIGLASRFDGNRSALRVANSSSGKLAPSQGATFTMSCWARLNRYTTEIGQVVGFGEFGSRLYFKPVQTVDSAQSDTNVWVARDHRTTPKMGGPFLVKHADTMTWTHLALTVEGDSVRFYVDGARQTKTTKFDNSSIPRTTGDFVIGAATDTLGELKWSFPGDIAEVWMQSQARSEDWLRLAWANQRPDAPIAKSVK